MLDHMQVPLGRQPPRGHVDPRGQGRVLGTGGFAAGIVGAGAGLRVEIRRIGQHMIKPPLAQIGGQIGQIGGHDAQILRVLHRIAPRQIRIARLPFDPGDAEPRHPGHQAQRRRPGTTAQLQHGLPSPRGHRRSQQNRVHPRAIPFARLKQMQPPAQKRIARQ